MQLFYPLGLPSDNIGINGFHNTTKNQSYIPITGCILSHILSSLDLSSLEKMYYILADSISYINFSKGRNRSVSLPAKSWSSRLSCSKSEVFVLQKSLEDKGYFLIHRDKNDKGQNNRNIITTTIPDKVFNDLKYEPDRFDLCDVIDEASHQNNSNNLDSIDKTYIPILEGKRQHLEKTKMFIRVPYQFLKQLNSNCNISATSKVIMLYLFTKIYKSTANKYNYDDSDSSLTRNSYSIVTSYQELQKELKLHRNSVSKALKTLDDNNLISKQRFFIKDTEDYNNSRADKSLWQISVLNVPLATNSNNQQEQKHQEERTNPQQALMKNQNQKEYIGQKQTVTSDQIKEERNNNEALESAKEWECTKYDPACTDPSQLYNKDFVLKNSIIENIDYIDENHLNSKNLSLNNLLEYIQSIKTVKKEFLENELCSFPSESYNNSSFLNKSFDDFTNTQQKNSDIFECKQPCSNTISEHNIQSMRGVMLTPSNSPAISVKTRNIVRGAEKKLDAGNTTTIKQEVQQKAQKDKWQELRHFYPLSEQDVDVLNCRANREFSNNFMNQLLLKLYIKYPEKRFKNKFTFLSYMAKILKNEKHQGPLVNHTSFRFSCNIGTHEKNQLKYEQYLSRIESSFDTSKEMQVRKKIAGRFSTEIAYKILTEVEFKTNQDNSFITALVPSHINLSQRQIACISEQLEAVYGINGYYVQEVGQEVIQLPKSSTTDTEFNDKSMEILDSRKRSESNTEAITENTVWNQVRKGLREELGDAIDEAWFSKAVATEDNETKILTLTMPTRFMADWIRNNYSYVIRRLSERCEIKRVEYNFSR